MSGSGRPARPRPPAFREALAFAVLFVAVHLVLAATTHGLSVAEVVELALITAPLVVFVVRRGTGPALAAACVAALLAAVALAATGLPVDGRVPGYSAWQFGAISLVLFGFSLTGRYWAAAAAMAGVVAVAIGWSVLSGQGALLGAELVARHVATLLVGTCYAVAFRRATTAASVFNRLTLERETLERTASAQAAARRAAAEVVLEMAGPMLAAIAEGKRLSDADRRELLVIEGALRDRIRGGAVLHGPLPDAVASARRRGLDVLVLDETAAQDAAAIRPVADWLADRLAQAPEGRFIARVRDDGEALRATAVSGARRDSVSFPHAGQADTQSSQHGHSDLLGERG